MCLSAASQGRPRSDGAILAGKPSEVDIEDNKS